LSGWPAPSAKSVPKTLPPSKSGKRLGFQVAVRLHSEVALSATNPLFDGWQSRQVP